MAGNQSGEAGVSPLRLVVSAATEEFFMQFGFAVLQPSPVIDAHIPALVTHFRGQVSIVESDDEPFVRSAPWVAVDYCDLLSVHGREAATASIAGRRPCQWKGGVAYVRLSNWLRQHAANGVAVRDPQFHRSERLISHP